MMVQKKICGICGKKLGLCHYMALDGEICANCFGLVLLFCKEEEIRKKSVEYLRSMKEKDICELCGNRLSNVQKKYVSDGLICKKCEKKLRTFYPDQVEKAVSFGVNAIGAALDTLTDTTSFTGGFSVSDPIESATLEELQELYRSV